MKDLMRQTDIRVGDTVRLKGGGPIMTVEAIHTIEFGEEFQSTRIEVNCVWFNGMEVLDNGSFSSVTLEKC